MPVPPDNRPSRYPRYFDLNIDRCEGRRRFTDMNTLRPLVPSSVFVDRTPPRSNALSLIARLRGKKRKQDGTCTHVQIGCSAENLLAVRGKG